MNFRGLYDSLSPDEREAMLLEMLKVIQQPVDRRRQVTGHFINDRRRRLHPRHFLPVLLIWLILFAVTLLARAEQAIPLVAINALVLAGFVISPSIKFGDRTWKTKTN